MNSGLQNWNNLRLNRFWCRCEFIRTPCLRSKMRPNEFGPTNPGIISGQTDLGVGANLFAHGAFDRERARMNSGLQSPNNRSDPPDHDPPCYRPCHLSWRPFGAHGRERLAVCADRAHWRRAVEGPLLAGVGGRAGADHMGLWRGPRQSHDPVESAGVDETMDHR